jgi:hypothetical protein
MILHDRLIYYHTIHIYYDYVYFDGAKKQHALEDDAPSSLAEESSTLAEESSTLAKKNDQSQVEFVCRGLTHPKP